MGHPRLGGTTELGKIPGVTLPPSTGINLFQALLEVLGPGPESWALDPPDLVSEHSLVDLRTRNTEFSEPLWREGPR